MDLRAWRQYLQNELISLLDKLPGKKCLILDEKIVGLLSLVVPIGVLRQYGVEAIHKFSAEPSQVDPGLNIVFVLRPNIEYMNLLVQQMKLDLQQKIQDRTFSVLFVPRRSVLSEGVLEDAGVWGNVDIMDFNMGMVPIDSDLLSFEMQNFVRDCYLEKDYTPLYEVANNLFAWQKKYGPFTEIKGKGDAAKELINMLQAQHTQHAAEYPRESHVQKLLVIDRSVDWVTPMLFPLTYESLIDEVFGIKGGFVDLDSSLVPSKDKPGDNNNNTEQPPQPAEKKTIKKPLNSDDVLYQQIRHRHIKAAGPYLHEQAKNFAQLKNVNAASSIAELKQMTEQLRVLEPQRQSLSLHSNIAAQLIKFVSSDEFHRIIEFQQNSYVGVNTNQDVAYLEECIYKKEPLSKVLRLFIVVHLTVGLNPKQFEFIKNEIYQTYGHHHLLTFMNFEQVGLLRSAESKSNFSSLAKKWRLMVDDVDEVNPNDSSFAFSGQASITMRLIEQEIKGIGDTNKDSGWSAAKFQEINAKLPGATSSFVPSLGPIATLPPARVMVLFLGGCTQVEIAMLRYLSSVFKVQFVVLTTRIVNGNTLLQELIETFH
jgi:hypothetical protein